MADEHVKDADAGTQTVDPKSGVPIGSDFFVSMGEKHRIKVDDKDVLVSYDQMLKDAQMGRSSQKAWEEAKKMRDESKKLESKAKLADQRGKAMADYKAAQEGDAAAARRLHTYPEFGITQESGEEYAASLESKSPTEGDEGGSGGVDPETRRRLEELEAEKEGRDREQSYRQFSEHLAKEKRLTYALGDESRANALTGHGFSLLMRRAKELGRNGQKLSASDLQSAVEATVLQAKTFGVLEAPVKSTSSNPADLSGLSLGGSPSSARSSLHRNSEPIKKVSALSPEYSNNMLLRMQQKLANRQRAEE